MRTRVQLALMGCLVSIGVHLYMALHYYALKFGFADSKSVCNVNATFDCDAASASAFAAVLGIPLSAWGAIVNFVLLLMILASWLEWSENPERLKRWTLLLAGLSFAASVVMATISVTQMTSYCPFCIALYALSAIVFFAFKGLLREPFSMHLKLDLPVLWSESKGIVAAFVAIPILSFLMHQMYLQNLGASEVGQIVQEVMREWEAAPVQNFVAKPMMVAGPAAQSASMTLVEFADYRCGHCKRASYTIHAFVKSHPDIRFEFYSFPLDGACNEKIESANGMSCRLAAAVYCAEKEGKAWELHQALFDMQEQMNGAGSPAAMDPLLSQAVTKLGMNWERIMACLADPLSQEAIRAQAKQGALVDVRGTPTIFSNGKLLPRGNMMPVLEAVRAKIMSAR